ncbi:MAG: MopE-related protein [Minicystis sp.]
MFLGVNGLLAPCVPSPEICDGQDNNCDGLIDNNPVDAGGACGLSAVGECKLGVLACQGGSLVCVGDTGPATEICDGKDNDCNGMIDDNPVGVGAVCGSNVGECQFGAQQCIGGVLVCQGGKGPQLEVCDGKDNDCNGATDDNPIDTGGPCGSNVGACTPGQLTCVNGNIVCVGGTSGGPEICDGIDNDCNGFVDDNPAGVGDPCGSSMGLCKPGVTHCVGGAVVCIGGVGATQETCDGLDNDCNGVADDGATCPGGAQCIEGVCASPCMGGEFPCPGATVCKNGFCVPATCDGVTCKTGEVCMQGVCVPETDGGMGASSSSSSSSSSSGNASSSSGAGTGGNGNGGAGNGGDDGTTHRWGLATGGGGIICSYGAGPASTLPAGVLAALALIGARRRRGSVKASGSRRAS